MKAWSNCMLERIIDKYCFNMMLDDLIKNMEKVVFQSVIIVLYFSQQRLIMAGSC